MAVSRGLWAVSLAALVGCTPLVASYRADAGDSTPIDIGSDIGADVGMDGGSSDVGVDAPGDVGVDVGPFRCATSGDCADSGIGTVCDTATGRCVECVASADTCPTGRYCVEATQRCAPGCRDDDGCVAAAGDGGAVVSRRCEVTTHACVACVVDSHCPPGNLCMGNACVTGCSATQACPSGQTCCAGGCVDTASNVANCGACGTACAVANATAACVGGACRVAGCTAPFADCDGMATNGCETDTATSGAHCGACGTACAPAHATGACAAGRCGVGACAAGYADCDGDAANGCEVNVVSGDINHCGNCTAACPPPPVGTTAVCSASACGISADTCPSDRRDCNATSSDGCEVTILTDPNNCGACGTRCSTSGGTAGCAGGSCSIACTAGFGNCDGVVANGCETNTTTSPTNCGGCNSVCSLANATAACSAGACAVTTCNGGYGNCDGMDANGCEANLRSNPSNCGACGAVCPARSNAVGVCQNGACGSTCNGGFGDCNALASDGCEVDLTTSPSHCGGCGRECAAPVGGSVACVSAACVQSCPSGQTPCGGACAGIGVGCTSGSGACARTGVSVCGTSAVQRVAAGDSHSCSLHANGTVRCWGNNLFGQLGDGTTTASAVPVLVVGLTGVVEISVGGSHSCARLMNGTVRCWGRNVSGQLGDGSTTDRLAPVTVTSVGAVVEVVAAGSYTCARLADGTLRCWGANSSGQLGDGSTISRPTPVAVAGLVGVVQMAAKASFTCARLTGGTVQCWGDNTYGQLGDGSTTNRASPVVVTGLSSAVEVATGGYHTCARLLDGTVRCWGSNGSGQVGDGTTATARPSPVAVLGLSGVVEVALGESHTCARLADNTLRCWGRNDYGQLGDASTIVRTAPVVVSSVVGVAQIAAGFFHTCARSMDGTIRCWGRNNFGQLGDDDITDRYAPIAVPGLTGVVEIAAGSYDTCGRRADGTMHCWGNNTNGQVGNGTHNTNVLSPVAVTGIVGAVGITVGADHTCARLLDDTARCWGSNAYGQIGDGSDVSRDVPVPVSGLAGVAEIETGFGHTCARLTDGTARCWGRNDYGSIGDGSMVARLTPVAVSGLAGVAELTAGALHTCARLTGGGVRCWGRNLFGELGDGSGTNRYTPVAVSGLTGVVEISAGSIHTCARLTGGGVWCWGSNSVGQLGDGSATSRNVPVAVAGLVGATEISAGGEHTCARLMDGTVRCWGGNSYGQLGDGSVTNRLTPVAVLGLTGVAEIATGFNHTCARLTNGTIRCWGYNAEGQIGDGTESRTRSSAPLVVPFRVVAPVCNATPGAPAAEVCGNGADEDCDEVVDNGCLSQASCPTPAEPGCGMVELTGGSFTMGQTGAVLATPTMPGISVGNFALDSYEVTVARFRRFWDAGHPSIAGGIVRYPEGVDLPWMGAVAEPGGNWSRAPGSLEGHPINSITWYTAQAFCVWDGGRLPTEAEAEFAARTSAGFTYPWGEAAPGSLTCWSGGGTSRTGTCPVGSFPSTRGFYDLSGNANEWVADNHENYGAGCWSGAFRTRNPLCVTDPMGVRSKRGGGYWGDASTSFVRGASRSLDVPLSQDSDHGMRCARSR